MKPILTIMFLLSILLTQDRDLLDVPPDPTEYELWAGVVNADEEINIGDTVLMVSLILDIIDCPPNNSPCEYNYSECCLDTTSHDFSWVVDTLGNLYSIVHDAWVFNEDHIWVVAEFYVGELGMDQLYGAAIWNGEEWKYQELPYTHDGWSSTLHPYGIWAFAPDDIWFANGSVFHYDGEIITLEWIREDLMSWESAHHIWASSPTDMYFVGLGELILHYDGIEFTQMEGAPVDIPLRDIWGQVDEDTGDVNVWVVAKDSQFNDSYLLRFDGTSWLELVSNPDPFDLNPEYISGSMKSVWSDQTDLYVLTDYGIYKCNYNTEGEGELIVDFEPYTPAPRQKIRGNNNNDIFIAGFGGEIWHFNGESWYQYSELSNESEFLLSLTVNKNIVVSTEYRYQDFIYNPGIVYKRPKI